MRTIIFSSVLICGIVVIGGWTQEQSKKSSTLKEKKSFKKISYTTDVVPIFKKYCLPCHTEDQMNPSELYLDSYKNLMNGGKHGSAVVIGKPDSSILIQKLFPKPPFGDPMPLKRKTPFPEDTLNILKLWIKQGAKEN